jgi:hypothetical protein
VLGEVIQCHFMQLAIERHRVLDNDTRDKDSRGNLDINGLAVTSNLVTSERSGLW